MRSPYPPDVQLHYATLAAHDARLLPHLVGGYLDYSDAGALQALTGALLKVHWGIPEWRIPGDRLCPTLPSRLNYLLHIQDLLCSRLSLWPFLPGSPPTSAGGGTLPSPVGVDIGTGASCIFGLLGASACGFNTLGTEIDPVSAECAVGNVSRAGGGGGGGSVKVALVVGEQQSPVAAALPPHIFSSPLLTLPTRTVMRDAIRLAGNVFRSGTGPAAPPTESSVIPPSVQWSGMGEGSPPPGAAWDALSKLCHHPPRPSVDFTLCNPPFYSSLEEAARSIQGKAGSAGTGVGCELACEGGERAFIEAMVEESVESGVTWHTSWVCKGSNVGPLVACVRGRCGGDATVRVTALKTGNTTRWVLAWSPFLPPPAFLAKGWEFQGGIKDGTSPVYPMGEKVGCVKKKSTKGGGGRGGGEEGGGRWEGGGEEWLAERENATGSSEPAPPTSANKRTPSSGLVRIIPLSMPLTSPPSTSQLPPSPPPIIIPPAKVAVGSLLTYLTPALDCSLEEAPSRFASASPLPLEEVASRLQEALKGFEGEGGERSKAVVLFWEDKGEGALTMVHLPALGDCVGVWRGGVVVGEARGEEGGGLRVSFTFEVQIRRNPALNSLILAVCCLTEGGGGGGEEDGEGSGGGVNSPKAHFKRFSEALERDVCRTGRAWRRREKRGREGGETIEQQQQ